MLSYGPAALVDYGMAGPRFSRSLRIRIQPSRGRVAAPRRRINLVNFRGTRT